MEGTQWSRGFRITVICLLFLLASLVALGHMTTRVADPDMFWHVETGRWIVEHRAIPQTDVFSWYGESARLPWVTQEWLWDVGAFGIYAAGGYAALYGLTAALYGTLIVLCFYWLRRRIDDDIRVLALSVVMMAGTFVYALPRPQVLTYLLLVVLFIALDRKWWYAAPLVMLLIANLHGATYPLFLFVAALYLLPRHPIPLAATVAAVMLQPHGLAVLVYPFSFAPESRDIVEWGPTVLSSQPVMAVTMLALAVLVSWRTVKWRPGLIALAGTALSLVAVRHVAFFFLLAVPSLAPYLPASTVPSPRLRRQLDVGIAAILAVGSVAMGALALSEPFVVDRGYPREASEYLRRNNIERFWNAWGDGGYLIAQGMRPFVDGRADPFFSKRAEGGRFVTAYVDAVTLRSDIRPLLERHGIKYLLVGKDTRLHVALALSDEFRVAYEDDEDTVFRYSPNRPVPAVGANEP